MAKLYALVPMDHPNLAAITRELAAEAAALGGSFVPAMRADGLEALFPIRGACPSLGTCQFTDAESARVLLRTPAWQGGLTHAEAWKLFGAGLDEATFRTKIAEDRADAAARAAERAEQARRQAAYEAQARDAAERAAR